MISKRRQLRNFFDDARNIAYKSDIITKKKYRKAPEIDGLMKKKQKMSIKQNYDKEVSVFSIFY